MKDLKLTVLLNIAMKYAGGFGSYLLGMDQMFHDRVDTKAPGDIPGNEAVKNPGLGWMTGFLFTVSFVGIFSIVVLRKVLLYHSNCSVISSLLLVYSILSKLL